MRRRGIKILKSRRLGVKGRRIVNNTHTGYMEEEQMGLLKTAPFLEEKEKITSKKIRKDWYLDFRSIRDMKALVVRENTISIIFDCQGI